MTLGETDDFSYNIVKDPVEVYDLNATILHLHGDRPHAADLQVPGPRLPADGRAWEGGQADSGVRIGVRKDSRIAGASGRTIRKTIIIGGLGFSGAGFLACVITILLAIWP